VRCHSKKSHVPGFEVVFALHELHDLRECPAFTDVEAFKHRSRLFPLGISGRLDMVTGRHGWSRFVHQKVSNPVMLKGWSRRLWRMAKSVG
jgi:hypothetical protein